MNRLEADQEIRFWFAKLLAAVDPESLVEQSIRCDQNGISIGAWTSSASGCVVVVAVGKAAAAMARGCRSVCDSRIDRGYILTTDGNAFEDLSGKWLAFTAGHPILDQRGIDATREIVEWIKPLGSEDTVIALISGGGSALLESPPPSVTLSDLAELTRLMLQAGAPIHHLNAVRIPLSRVKGGGLRRISGAGTFVTLILSDVLGNDPRVIASGPTVESNATAAAALDLIDHYGLRSRVPKAVIEALSSKEGGAEKWEHPNDLIEVIGDNHIALQAGSAAAAVQGLRSEIIWTSKEGEAGTLGAEWARRCLSAAPNVDVLWGGGEATVTVTGGGNGGRNTEFALAAALELERLGLDNWTIASLATDGQDATTGAAGAIANVAILATARTIGVDPVHALQRNDSCAVFSAGGGLVRTGPTGTNVNDVYIAVRTDR
jgi:glycerate 2-kinase